VLNQKYSVDFLDDQEMAEAFNGKYIGTLNM
jgi:hypothetical protein